jgi:hypothetical protein
MYMIQSEMNHEVEPFIGFLKALGILKYRVAVADFEYSAEYAAQLSEWPAEPTLR